MTYKKQKMMNADVLTFSQGSLSGSGYLENDSSESQCCSQKALLLFHHSFVDHYLEAYVCSVKQHWKDDVLKSYNSSSEAIYLRPFKNGCCLCSFITFIENWYMLHSTIPFVKSLL